MDAVVVAPDALQDYTANTLLHVALRHIDADDNSSIDYFVTISKEICRL